jgi:hypothetical protein
MKIGGRSASSKADLPETSERSEKRLKVGLLKKVQAKVPGVNGIA